MTNKEKYKTPKERIEAFHRFCKGINCCSACPIGKVPIDKMPMLRCPFAWLALEAEEHEDKLLPCPFCSWDSIDVFATDFGRSEDPCQFVVKCLSCGACVSAEDRGAAIAAWNRRVK